MPSYSMTSALKEFKNAIAEHWRVRGSLRRTLLTAFLALILPALGGVSAVTTSRQYESSRQRTISQLTSVATLKEADVTMWFNSLAPDLELVVADPHVRSDITQLITTQENEFVSNAWRGVLLNTLAVAQIAGGKFEEISLTDTTGKVIVSTNSNRNGQSYYDQPFFKPGLSTAYLQMPSYFSPYGIVTFAAVPVRDDKGIVYGVLVGVANLNALNNIMQERAGLGRTGETYLVSSDKTMLTKPRDSAIPEFLGIDTQGARAALSGMDGSGLYENYQSPPVPVVGAYRWIPKFEVALLAEQSQAEAFEDTVWGIWTLLGVTIFVGMLTVAAAVVVSRNIAVPLEDLTSLATRIAGGDLTQMVLVERPDEIGKLAKAFNTMTIRLRELIGNLEQRVAARTLQLQKELGERERAENALQKARNDLTALYQVTATSSQALDLSTLLAQSLAQIVDALHSDGGVAFALGENQNESSTQSLQLVAHQGISPHAVEQMTWFIAHRGLASWGAHRDLLVIPDVTADNRVPEPLRRIAKVGIVIVPMRAEGQVWGVLGLIRNSGANYRDEELALLTSIANQVGIAIRSHHLRQRAQQATILEERQRLARELHDSVTQMLYSLMLFAEAATDSAEKKDSTQMASYLNRLRETAQQALREMRLLIFESRSQVLEEEGIIGALRRRLEVVENRSGMETELLADISIDLPDAVQIELYGIAQEALNNILKHSGATHVTVQIKVTDRVHLQITDNGRGFVRNGRVEKVGIGLTSMRERAERLGGTLRIDSAPGEGTSVQFWIPLPYDVPHISNPQEERA